MSTDTQTAPAATTNPGAAARPVLAPAIAGRQIPWTLILFLIAALIPLLGSRYYTFLATDVIIFAMFATSLNLLLGVTGLVPFGHAAYFGIGAYFAGIL